MAWHRFVTAGLGAVELAYLNDQRIDVKEQISYIKSLPAFTTELIRSWKLADPKRIVILGHSYGGALAVFANTEGYGQSVAIDISEGELSWTNSDEPYWSFDLQGSMFKQKRPIYLFQPKNAKSLAPTKMLFSIAVDQLYHSQAAIFPRSACPRDQLTALKFSRIRSALMKQKTLHPNRSTTRSWAIPSKLLNGVRR